MLTRKFLVIVIVMNFVFAPFAFRTNTVSAREIAPDINVPDSNSTSKQCLATESKNIIELDQETTRRLFEIVQVSNEFGNFEAELDNNNKSALTTENQLRLDVEKSYAYQIGEIMTLYIPISGGAGNSFYGVQFDKSLTIIGSMAGIFKLTAENNILFHYRINDQTIADLIISEQGEVLGGNLFDLSGNKLDLQERINQSSANGNWWNCMNNCLTAQGVPLYLVAGLSLICAAVCFATAGIACGACISAALGAWSAVGVFCLGACADGQW